MMHNMSTITPRIASRTVTISRVSIPSLMITGADVVDSWVDFGVELTRMDWVECYDKDMVTRNVLDCLEEKASILTEKSDG